MKRLSVNIDHVATLRQARGERSPDPVSAALIAEVAGADGIVCHLREDRRHIQDNDVYLLRKVLTTKLDLEMAATDEIVGVALNVIPDLVTLVPERRAELTTEGGLDVVSQYSHLKNVITRFHAKDILVSLFIAPDEAQVTASRKAGADFVELHTGEYANSKGPRKRDQLERLKKAAKSARKKGLMVNAGHGLDYKNLAEVASVEEIEEFSIGHALICRALLVGMERAVKEMMQILRESER
ncbi:MAG TPA: pyridoxine 5'-phosphate synthase [Candidatus Kryptonia bacterium]